MMPLTASARSRGGAPRALKDSVGRLPESGKLRSSFVASLVGEKVGAFLEIQFHDDLLDEGTHSSPRMIPHGVVEALFRESIQVQTMHEIGQAHGLVDGQSNVIAGVEDVEEFESREDDVHTRSIDVPKMPHEAEVLSFFSKKVESDKMRFLSRMFSSVIIGRRGKSTIVAFIVCGPNLWGGQRQLQRTTITGASS